MDTITCAALTFAALCLLLVVLMIFRRKCTPQFDIEKQMKISLKAIRKGDDQALFDSVDLFVEEIAKSTRLLNLLDARMALKAVLVLPESFVKVQPRGPSMADISMLDRVNYLSAYLLRRFEWLFQTALQEQVEPVAEEILTAYAKMSFIFAKFHPTLAYMPLVFLERSIQIAISRDKEEVAARCEVILSELIKSFIALSQEKQESLLDLILRALSHLERGVKQSYKHNNEMGVALLMQPFAEIASYVVDEQYKAVPRRDEILAELKRMLQQFTALESVLQKSASSIDSGSDGQ